MSAAFLARGACPALDRPMPTGDGLLVRLRPLDGALVPAALGRLAALADRHGNGIVEVTARGSLQLRGLSAQSAPRLAAEVAALGLDLAPAPTVETAPLAGLDPTETADARPLAAALRAAIARSGLAGGLAPKLAVTVDGGGRLGLAGLSADIRLAALPGTAAASGPLWHVALGGDAATARALGAVRRDDAPAALVALLRLLAAAGPTARGRDLDAGAARAALAPFLVAADRSPAAGAAEPVGRFALAVGRQALGLGLAFGSVAAATLARLAERASGCGIEGFRLAPGRALLAVGPAAAGTTLAAAAGALGFVTAAGDPRRAVEACPGAPACASAGLATRHLAARLAAQAPALLDGSAVLHFSGCAKGCARPAAAGLALVGRDGDAALVVAGRAGDPPVAAVPAAAAPDALARLVALCRRERRGGESAAACLARLGTDRLAAAFEDRR